MQIVRLHIHHSRYPSATRPVVPHPYRFASDLGPEACHVLCAAILTEFVPALDPVDREGLDLLLSTLGRGLPGTSLEAPRPARHPRPRRESSRPRDRERRFVGVDRPSRGRRAASRRGSRGTVLPGGPTQVGSTADRPPRIPVPGGWVHRPRRPARLLAAGGFPPRSARECGRCANRGSKSSTFGMPR